MIEIVIFISNFYSMVTIEILTLYRLNVYKNCGSFVAIKSCLLTGLFL